MKKLTQTHTHAKIYTLQKYREQFIQKIHQRRSTQNIKYKIGKKLKQENVYVKKDLFSKQQQKKIT